MTQIVILLCIIFFETTSQAIAQELLFFDMDMVVS